MKPTLETLLKLKLIKDVSTERQKKNGTTEFRSINTFNIPGECKDGMVRFAFYKNGTIRDLTSIAITKISPENIFYKVMVEHLFPTFKMEKRCDWGQYNHITGPNTYQPGKIIELSPKVDYVFVRSNTHVTSNLKKIIDGMTVKDIKDRIKFLNNLNKEYTKWYKNHQDEQQQIDDKTILTINKQSYGLPLEIFKPYSQEWMNI